MSRQPQDARRAQHRPGTRSPSQLLERIQRRRNRRRAFAFAMLALLIAGMSILAVYSIANRMKPQPGLDFLREGTLSRVVEATGLIARAETILTAPAAGQLHPLVADGSRSGVGAKPAVIVPAGSVNLIAEIRQLDAEIARRQHELSATGKNSAAQAVFAESAAALAGVFNLIRTDIAVNDLSNCGSYEASIGAMLDQRTARLERIDFQDGTLTRLKEDKATKERSPDFTAGRVVLDQAGIVSFSLNPSAAAFTDQTIMSVTDKSLAAALADKPVHVSKIGETVHKGDPVVRLITGRYQFFAFLLPGVSPETFQLDTYLNMETADRVLIRNCRVMRSDYAGTGALVIFRTDDRVEWLAGQPTVRVSLKLPRPPVPTPTPLATGPAPLGTTKTEAVQHPGFAPKSLLVPLNALYAVDEEVRGRGRLMLVVQNYARSVLVDIIDRDKQQAVIRAIQSEPYQPEVNGMYVRNPASVEEGQYVGR